LPAIVTLSLHDALPICFAGPVFWTNALAWPLAAWIMLRWLEQFPYRIENWWLLPVCFVAGAVVIGIVMATVGATVVRLVNCRPADRKSTRLNSSHVKIS